MQYLAIKDIIIEQISSGQLSARQKLPSERKLAESFSTTRVTLREALSLLEAEGRIYREDRRGWFISPSPLRYDPTQNLTFEQLAKTQQRVPTVQLLTAKSSLANPQASRLLQLKPFSEVYHLERVRCLEQRPVAFVTNYLSPERFPNLLTLELSQSLTWLYQQHFFTECATIRYRITSRSLLGEMAQALRTTQGTPAMVIERVRYDAQGGLIDTEISYWRHDAIVIESLLTMQEQRYDD
ncbi:phosphonate utilization transcriptional regulator PhnR [Vibrio metschnikovii]|uniref:phosphonate utilization transcriptional regulator PhnR n=1 Tax=Vibrio metschnikovii TaxID=28172 RepID=UPI001C309D6E